MPASHKAARADAFIREFTNSPWTGRDWGYNHMDDREEQRAKERRRWHRRWRSPKFRASERARQSTPEHRAAAVARTQAWRLRKRAEAIEAAAKAERRNSVAQSKRAA